jgi:hypothetical protein
MTDKSNIAIAVSLDALNFNHKATYINTLIDKMNELKDEGYQVVIQSNQTTTGTKQILNNLQENHGLQEPDLVVSWNNIKLNDTETGFWNKFLAFSKFNKEDIIFVAERPISKEIAERSKITSIDWYDYTNADWAENGLTKCVQGKLKLAV